MEETAAQATHTHSDSGTRADPAHSSYEPPRFEVISLDCEISAYAPDEDDTPLF